MIAILPQESTIWDLLGGGLGQGIAQGAQQQQQLSGLLALEQEKQQGTLAEKLLAAQQKLGERESRKAAFTQLGLDPALADLDPRIAAEYAKDQLFSQMFGGEQQPSVGIGTQKQGQDLGIQKPQIDAQPEPMVKGPFESMSDAQLRMYVSHPRYGKSAESELKRRENEQTIQRQEKVEDRKYHTEFSKEFEKTVNQLRDVLPKKESALDFARNAIETGDVSYFSADKLADATGIDLFRTAKGAQLVTAGKENLLNNMGRVSARAQNLWFEQRLNSMFPKIGQSKEANLTIAEMLEGENFVDRAYVEAFDRLADQDEKNYGYVKKDVSKRARNEVKDIEKHVFNRASFRMKEIEESEKGLTKLKKEVGKKVVKGTPLTLSMAKLYKKEFGDKALEVAQKNGYTIPTVEEYKSYQSRPGEFRENL